MLSVKRGRWQGRVNFATSRGGAARAPDSGETAPIAGPRGRLGPRPRSDRTAHASPAASPPNLNLLLKYAPLLSPFSRTPSAPARSQGQVHRAIPSAGHGVLRAHLPRPAGGGGRRRARDGEQAAEQAAAAAAAPVRAGRAAPRLLLGRHGPCHPRLPPVVSLHHHHRHDGLEQQLGAPGGGGAGVAAVPFRRRGADGVRGGRRRRAARPRAAGAEAQGAARGGDRRGRVRGQPPGGPPPGARRQRDRGGQLLHGAQGERGAPRREPQLRDDPARRRGADPAGGGPDLPPRLPGLPGALQVQPRQDHQDQRGGHAQHARPRQARRRPLPPHQHQRGLRRPPPAPPGRDLLGQRQPHRCAELLRRGQEDGGDTDHGLPPRRQPRGEDRADLQHLRAAHVHRRWPGRQQLCRPGTEEGAPDGVRRRQADEELPVRLRSGRGSDEADGGGSRGAVQPGEPGGVHDAGAGQGGAGHHRPQRADRVPGQHRRRPAQAQAGHHQGQGAARVGAQGGAPQRPPAHGPGLPHPYLRRPEAAAAATRRRRVVITRRQRTASRCHFIVLLWRIC